MKAAGSTPSSNSDSAKSPCSARRRWPCTLLGMAPTGPTWCVESLPRYSCGKHCFASVWSLASGRSHLHLNAVARNPCRISRTIDAIAGYHACDVVHSII